MQGGPVNRSWPAPRWTTQAGGTNTVKTKPALAFMFTFSQEIWRASQVTFFGVSLYIDIFLPLVALLVSLDLVGSCLSLTLMSTQQYCFPHFIFTVQEFASP